REPIAAAKPRLATLSNKVTRTAARFKIAVILEIFNPES
ncbi:MAG: hypothetical protein PWQ07_1242, partial [Kosmotoga sp.]|nr:hypothetical protein [Kosmotoga sp.]